MRVNVNAFPNIDKRRRHYSGVITSRQYENLLSLERFHVPKIKGSCNTIEHAKHIGNCDLSHPIGDLRKKYLVDLIAGKALLTAFLYILRLVGVVFGLLLLYYYLCGCVDLSYPLSLLTCYRKPLRRMEKQKRSKGL